MAQNGGPVEAASATGPALRWAAAKAKHLTSRLTGLARQRSVAKPRPFWQLLHGDFAFFSYGWTFQRLNGDLLDNWLRFLPDGRILGAANSNEKFWQLDADGQFAILSDTRQITTIFERIVWQGPLPVLYGRYTGGDVIHVLAPNCRDLQIEIVQRQFSGGMLIVPGSRGRPFDGIDTRWELWDFPRRHRIDHMRIAEHIDQPFWYVNKTRRLAAYCEMFVRQGYRSFCFFGMSSGGYAALLLAERLAARFADLRITTIVLNPQTILGSQVSQDFQLRGIPRNLWPDMIGDDELAQRDEPVADIGAVMALNPNRGHLTHHIFYDSLNPCEAFFCGHLGAFEGVQLHPAALGVGHAEGIGRMYHENLTLIEHTMLAALTP